MNAALRPTLRGLAVGCLGLAVWLACDSAQTPDETEPARVSLDHIPANPPGGRWMAQSDNAADFVRRFEQSGETILVGVPLARVIALAHDIHPGDVVLPPWGREIALDAIVKPPRGEADRSFEILREMLREDFGWVVARREVALRAMVLEPAPGSVPLEPSRSEEGFLELKSGRLTARGATIAQLIELLRRDVESPIVDESRLPGRYDFVLQWDPGKGAYAFLQALADIGLRMEARVRKVDRYFVASTGRVGAAREARPENGEGVKP